MPLHKWKTNLKKSLKTIDNHLTCLENKWSKRPVVTCNLKIWKEYENFKSMKPCLRYRTIYYFSLLVCMVSTNCSDFWYTESWNFRIFNCACLWYKTKRQAKINYKENKMTFLLASQQSTCVPDKHSSAYRQ